ncbi:LPS assembly lipoprotein LptE [Azomonas macrocytogenes]|uniref:LPS-assembly lipoprotein LptE n=1 Tax=Azomonas macrocytogenes TaxID=69962 RepID=A0A839T1Y8_AZOMA|nr:LPS assembly lipoprotein LptE [Azomonas macrocytogenes]MBB3102526.1 LPS-assembly lipoprotein [Azomonas macrocytogenes]
MFRRNLVILGLSLLLTACGFQLRGTGTNEFSLRELNLEARDTYGETLRQLRTLLESNGVKINPGAQYTFNLLDEQTSRRTSSYTSSARTAEYQLRSTITYEFRDRNGLQLLQDSVEARKIQSFDENNIIGSYQEATLLRDEMRRELVQQMVAHLQRVTPEQLDKLHQDAETKAQAEAQAKEAERRLREGTPQQSPVEPPPMP